MGFEKTAHDDQYPKENIVVKLTGKETLVREKRDVPTTCGPWDAIVCPKRTGICGSDMHVYLDHMGNKTFSNPIVLGHECAGIVHKVGENVRHLKAGDRVALEPGETCRRCHACKTGHYAHCENIRFAAAKGVDGTLQGYYILPADLCYKLPEGMSLEEGALMEPLSVAVNAVSSIAALPPLSTVVVFGAGPVGLLVMAVCKAFGAKRIIGVDINASRLAFAETRLGIETHLALTPEQDEDRTVYTRRHADHIKEKYGFPEHGREGVGYVFECSGAEPSVQTGLWLLRRRGLYVQVGNGPLYQNIPLLMVTDRELTIKGSFRYGPGAYETAIDLVARGLIDLKPLITHRFSFDDVQLAFETTKNGSGPDGKSAIKVMIEGPKVT